MLDPVIHKMITYVQNLEEKDLKDKVPQYPPALYTHKALLYIHWDAPGNVINISVQHLKLFIQSFKV